MARCASAGEGAAEPCSLSSASRAPQPSSFSSLVSASSIASSARRPRSAARPRTSCSAAEAEAHPRGRRPVRRVDAGRRPNVPTQASCPTRLSRRRETGSRSASARTARDRPAPPPAAASIAKAHKRRYVPYAFHMLCDTAQLPPLHSVAFISSRPISIRRISDVPAPISISLASRMIRLTGAVVQEPRPAHRLHRLHRLLHRLLARHRARRPPRPAASPRPGRRPPPPRSNRPAPCSSRCRGRRSSPCMSWKSPIFSPNCRRWCM